MAAACITVLVDVSSDWLLFAAEFRPLLDGVEHADSFNFNPHKVILAACFV